MNNIQYTVTDAKDIDLIEPLWRELIMYHRKRIKHFRKLLDSIDFEKRKGQLIEKSRAGVLRIDLAHDADDKKIVGYCVGSVDDKKQGEIDSICVDSSYRRSGIAGNLMRRALEWMDEMAVENKILIVAAGNEEVFAFYERYGFHPRSIVLEQIEDE